MKHILFSGKSEADLKLLIQLAQKMGIETKALNIEDWEDIGLAYAIDQGKTGEFTNTNAFLKKLRS